VVETLKRAGRLIRHCTATAAMRMHILLLIFCCRLMAAQQNNDPGPTILIGTSAILMDVEPEPGLTWNTPATTPASIEKELPVKADVGGSQFSSSSSNLDHFQRLTERLTSIESLQVQTLLKLEGLDYRLTRVEVQTQERSDSQRNLVTDAARRLQTMEGNIGRIQTVMDTIRDESNDIRSSQSELKYLFNSQSREGSTPGRGSDNVPRFQVLLAGLNGLRTTTNELRHEMANLQKNMTVLANLTRSAEKQNSELASKKDLVRGLAALNSDQSTPAHSRSHPSAHSCDPGTPSTHHLNRMW